MKDNAIKTSAIKWLDRFKSTSTNTQTNAYNPPTTPQHITPAVLATMMDSALTQAFGAYALSDVDELIARTGKSRTEVMTACLNDDEVAGCVEDIESAIKAKPWRIYDDVAADVAIDVAQAMW